MKAVVVCAFLALVVLVACGGASGGPAPSPSSSAPQSAPPSTEPSPTLSAQSVALDGRTFLSTSTTVDGTPHELVDGTRIRLTFEDGRIGASAGCNTMSGEYAIRGGRLVVDQLATTEMGCDPLRMDQDQWLASFLGADPSIALDGDTLTLTTPDSTMTLLDREVADPDRPLVGTVWTVDSIIDGDAISSVPAGVESTLRFGDDGVVQVDTGCNTGHGGYSVKGDHLTFDAIALTKKACHGPAGAMEVALLEVLSAPSVTFEITADVFQLTTPDGDGLGLRAP